MKREIDLINGKVGSTLIRFAVPYLLASVLQVMYGAIDTFFIGKYASAASISGVVSSTIAMGLITNLFLGLTMGGTVVMGQYFGAKREKETADTVGNIIVLFAVMAVVVTVLLYTLGTPLLRLIRVPEEAFGEAKAFLYWSSSGIVFIMGYNVVGSILRALGNSKAPLIFVAIACLTIIGMDYLLVGVAGLAAKGAAIATVTGQGLSFIIGIIYIKKTKLPFKFGRENIRFNFKLTARILKVGVPMALQNILITISFMLIQSIVNSMGVAASAAAGVVNRLVDCSMMIPSSLASAITAMSAQNIGAGKPERAKRSMYLGIIFSVIIAGPYLIAANIWPDKFVGILTHDPNVIAQGVLYLIPNTWDCLAVCFVFCMMGLFNGCGKTTFVLLQNVVGTFLLRLPIVFLVSRMADVTMFHIGLAMPIASCVSIVMCTVYLVVKFGGDKIKNIRISE